MITLEIYSLVDTEYGVGLVPFPDAEHQVVIKDYEHNASRMGGAPTIQAKFKYPSCLDSLWTGREVVFFKDGLYFARETPSSTKDNEDSRYEHDVTFAHERIVLENVYMVDYFDPERTHVEQKYVSNSTKVVFWGNIEEYVAKLNNALVYASLGGIQDEYGEFDGYGIVIDDDVDTSQELLVSFEDKFISEAIQEIFTTYKIPYYWDYKVVHVGVAPQEQMRVLEYGDGLLSIERQNTNNGYCNRATGVGSTDNIPYYYPNEKPTASIAPHAVQGEGGSTPNKGITDDSRISIIDQKKFDQLDVVYQSDAPFNNQGIVFEEQGAKLEFTELRTLTPHNHTYNSVSENAYNFNKNLMRDSDKVLQEGFFDSRYSYEAETPSSNLTYVSATGCNRARMENALFFIDRNTHQEACVDFVINHLRPFMAKCLFSTPRYMDEVYKCKCTQTGTFAKIRLSYEMYSAGDPPIGYNHAQDGTTSAHANVLLGIKKNTFKISLCDENGIDQQTLVHDIKVVSSEREYVNVFDIIISGKAFEKDKSYYLHARGDWGGYDPADGTLITFTALCDCTQGKIRDWVFGGEPNCLIYNYYEHGKIPISNRDFFYRGIMPWNYSKLREFNVFAKKGGVIFIGDYWEIYRYYLDGGINVPPRLSSPRRRFSLPQSLELGGVWEKAGITPSVFSIKNLADFGLATTQIPVHGDKILRYYKEEEGRIPIMQNLMPTIYRDTLGAKQFYNAINDVSKSEYPQYGHFYEDEAGARYHFHHEFTPDNPREAKFTFEDIKPTIKGTINDEGKRIDMFVDVAFDMNDNDYIKGIDFVGNDGFESEIQDAEYIHPYFYVKLPKTVLTSVGGKEYSFNLFEVAATEDMYISLTSGSCGGCRFKIMVDEDTKKNPVLTDEDGNLVYKDGEVQVIGWNSNSSKFVDAQQDTSKNEVWVALLKETDTYGIIMPNVKSKLRPNITDTYVLLNIYLPTAYIKDAEDRLSQAIIKSMWEANEETFNFSITFSRIFLAQNPVIKDILSENSQIALKYDNKIITLYVSSISYRQSASEVLPEITVELCDDVKETQNFAQHKEGELKAEFTKGSGGGVPFNLIMDNEEKIVPPDVYSAEYVRKHFLSKVQEDIAQRLIKFLEGIDVKGDAFFEDLKASSSVEVGHFLKGLVGATTGLRLDQNGNMYAKNVYIEESLNVPSIVYNRAMILDGIFIIAPAYGEIAEVEPIQATDEDGNLLYHVVAENGTRLYTNIDTGEPTTATDTRGVPVTTTIPNDNPYYGKEGYITLKLQDSEYPSIRLNDMLLGFWHDIQEPNMEDMDGVWDEEQQTYVHDGNYALSGFTSIYFSVTEYDKNSSGARFKYSLRSATDSDWTLHRHPKVGMKFYGYGNFEDTERQSLVIMTREYTVRLINKNWWTYDTDNIISIDGKLDGFSMRATQRNGTQYVKWFKGYGRVGGNEYIFGNIDQFERSAYRLEIEQSKQGFMGSGEVQVVTIKIYDGYGVDVTSTFDKFSLERNSNDPVADKQWNDAHKGQADNVFEITYADLNLREGVDFCTFTVTASNGEITLTK